MSGNIVGISGANWQDEVIQATVPVLVDFWANWCGPCKVILPILEDLQEDLKDKIKVVSVDVDDNIDLVQKNSIRSVPTLMIFVNGKQEDRWVGAANKAAIMKKLEAYLPHEKEN